MKEKSQIKRSIVELPSFCSWATEELRWDLYTCKMPEIENAIIMELQRRQESWYGHARRRSGRVAPGWKYEMTLTSDMLSSKRTK